MKAKVSSGFNWPYYYYIPSTLEVEKTNRILVLPYYSNREENVMNFHLELGLEKTGYTVNAIAENINLIIMRPVFPRSEKYWWYDTHSLDRDTLMVRKGKLKRIDIQLIRMIEDFRGRLESRGYSTHPKVLMAGYWKSALFTNRFTLLHPRMVQAALIGPTGGMPMVPKKIWHGNDLDYPLGTDDIRSITGQYFRWKEAKEIPMLFYQGNNDTRDVLDLKEGMDEEQKAKVVEIFGSSPIKRYRKIGKIYKDYGCNCSFRIYQDVADEITPPMRKDIIRFLKLHK
ncbi:MAG: hypothetical protein HOE90_22225 [Bacteriovoracaceae bacterium]|nr:hypothetical protein [Bacteriovoracaceae bacterium]